MTEVNEAWEWTPETHWGDPDLLDGADAAAVGAARERERSAAKLSRPAARLEQLADAYRARGDYYANADRLSQARALRAAAKFIRGTK